jgi:hypothetical protein
MAICEEIIMSQEHYGPDDLLTPQEAADYLARRWGRKSFSVEGLRALRRRINVPAKKLPRTTLYRRRDLDEIPEPDYRGESGIEE